MIGRAGIKPSRWYYGLAVLVILIGNVVTLLMVLSVAARLNDLSDELIHVTVPGTSDLTLTEPGRYVVFLVREGPADEYNPLSPDEISGLDFTLVAEETVVDIPLAKPNGTTRFSMGGEHGVSVLRFDLAESGVYVFSARYADGQAGPQETLAIGTGFIWGVVKVFLIAFVVIGASIILAIAIFWTTFYKRRKAIRALQAGE